MDSTKDTRTPQGEEHKLPFSYAKIAEVYSKLTEAINDGNLTAIIFHLKTKGKSRGYIEGQEITATVQSAKPMTQQEAQDFIQDLENKY